MDDLADILRIHGYSREEIEEMSDDALQGVLNLIFDAQNQSTSHDPNSFSGIDHNESANDPTTDISVDSTNNDVNDNDNHTNDNDNDTNNANNDTNNLDILVNSHSINDSENHTNHSDIPISDSENDTNETENDANTNEIHFVDSENNIVEVENNSNTHDIVFSDSENDANDTDNYKEEFDVPFHRYSINDSEDHANHSDIPISGSEYDTNEVEIDANNNTNRNNESENYIEIEENTNNHETLLDDSENEANDQYIPTRDNENESNRSGLIANSRNDINGEFDDNEALNIALALSQLSDNEHLSASPHLSENRGKESSHDSQNVETILQAMSSDDYECCDFAPVNIDDFDEPQYRYDLKRSDHSIVQDQDREYFEAERQANSSKEKKRRDESQEDDLQVESFSSEQLIEDVLDMPSEPEPNEPDTVNIAVMLPNGKRHTRYFYINELGNHVYLWTANLTMNLDLADKNRMNMDTFRLIDPTRTYLTLDRDKSLEDQNYMTNTMFVVKRK